MADLPPDAEPDTPEPDVPEPDADVPFPSPHEVPDKGGFPDEEVEIEEPREDEIPPVGSAARA